MGEVIFSPPTLGDWIREVEADTEPSFIIPGFLSVDSLTLLSGQPKDGCKTFFAMLTALVAATGKTVGPLRCDNPCKVLYIYREGARRPTMQRFKAIAAGNGFGDVRSVTNLFLHHRGNFFLDQGNWVTEVCRFIEQNSIGLVYIDTFAKSCQGDENSSKDMGIAIQRVEKMRNCGATVVLVHHLKKGNAALSGGKEGVPKPDEDIRGSSALTGAYEMHWAVRSYYDAATKTRDRTLLVGGKEADWTSYNYDWDFENGTDERGDEFLASVKLLLNLKGDLGHIEAPKENKTSHLRAVGSDDF